MMRASAIDHIALTVGDLDASTALYVDMLGFTLARSRPELRMNHLRVGSAMVDLVASDGVLGRRRVGALSRRSGTLDHICLRIDRFDAETARRELAAFGITAEEPALRYGAGGEGMSLYFHNSDGHRLELTGGAAAMGDLS